jgi:hypothetical protein
MKHPESHRFFLLATTLLLLTPFAPAQDSEAPAPPPTPARIARLKFISGTLTIGRSDNTAPDPGAETAVLNMPLPEGFRLVTADSGQAEIQFEDGSVARLAPNSALSIDSLALDENSVAHTQLTLLSGTAYFQLRHAPTGSFAVQAADTSVSPADNSSFRVEITQPTPTVSVFAGTLAATRPEGFATLIKSGESLRADPEDPTRYFLNQQIAENPSDAWSASRDQFAAQQAAVRTSARDAFAGAQGYGWSDLDTSGTWLRVPASANLPGDPETQTSDLVWQPNEASAPDSGESDFDPYADGAFVWSDTSYVWVSANSWGWLPYRCGRWVWINGLGWVWRPNRFCGVYGFGADAGYGGILIGKVPRRYPLPIHPLPGHTPVHPILRVHNPQVLHGDPHQAPVLLAVQKLPLIQAPLYPSTANLPTLYADFPVHNETKKPILGTIAPALSTEQPLRSGWTSHQSEPQPPTRNETNRTPTNNSAAIPTPRSTSHVAAPSSAPTTRPAPPPPAPAPSHPAPAPVPSGSRPK